MKPANCLRLLVAFVGTVTVRSQILTSLENVGIKTLSHEGIVPDVIDAVPPNELQVMYGVHKDNQPIVRYGNILTQNQTKDAPSFVRMENADPKKLYLLMMVDPDPPTRALPFLGEILHWMVANVPGGDVNAGETIVEYRSPHPPLLSGLHRFVFLMYEQPITRRMTFDKRDLPSTTLYSRFRFKARAFAKKYNLMNPVAANFYKTRYALSDIW